MPLTNTNPIAETHLDDDAPEEAIVIPIETNAAKPKRKAGMDRALRSSEPTAKNPSRHAESKADLALKKLRGAKGATVATLMQATGRQAHSVRGFLSGTVKKKLGLALVSEIGKDGMRRYRITDQAK